MEGKKLNFNAPLLSVRAKRKDKETPQLCKQLAIPARKSVSPPSCKQLSVPARKSVSELTELTKPAAVPFEWERTPGRPKMDGKREALPQKEPLPSPRFPPGRAFDIRKRVSGELLEHQNVLRPQTEASPLNENTSVVGMSEGCDSDDGDNAVLESLDELSQTESFSWSCSISGSSGNDGPFMQSSTTFRADPQTLDLMMARFLPAARAMIIETPKYVQKKKSVESQAPKNVKTVVSGELRPLLERYGSNTVPQHSPYKRNAFSEVEDDEYGNRHRRSGIACGLLPRLSVKRSLRFLDPVPRIKSRPQSPVSSASEVRRMARTAHSGPLPQIQQEKSIKDSYWDDIKIGVKQQELIENKLIGADQVRHSIDSNRKESLLPRTRSRSGCISPYRNEKPRSPFHDGARFLGVPKMVKSTESGNVNLTSKESEKFRDFSAYQMYKRESEMLSSLAERILYIDLVNNSELPILDSEEELLKKLSTKNLGESRGTEEIRKPKHLDAVKMVKSTNIGSTAAGSASSRGISNLKSRAKNIEVLKEDENLGPEARSSQCSIVHPAKNLACTENSEEVNDEENVGIGFPQSPLPPPLPKSPSEPWLWRNLSSISLRNPFSQGHPKKANAKNSSTSSKWATIVKSSNVSHDHKRYSEELVSHVSKQ